MLCAWGYERGVPSEQFSGGVDAVEKELISFEKVGWSWHRYMLKTEAW